MSVQQDSPATFAIRRRATDALMAKVLDKDQIRANIHREMLSAGLLTEDSLENELLVGDVFETAEYWVNPSVYIGRQ